MRQLRRQARAELLQDAEGELLAGDLAALDAGPELLDVLRLVGAELDEPLAPVVEDEEREAVAGPGLVRSLEVIVDRSKRPALGPAAEPECHQVLGAPRRVADLGDTVVGA